MLFGVGLLVAAGVASGFYLVEAQDADQVTGAGPTTGTSPVVVPSPVVVTTSAVETVTTPTRSSAPTASSAASAVARTARVPAPTTGPPRATVRAAPARSRPAVVVGRKNDGADLALGREVTASSVEGAVWAASRAVDGDPESRWGSSFADNQWISVDLGELWSVTRVELDWEAAYATEFRIDVSRDGSTWKAAYRTTAGTGGTSTITFDPVPARWVRVYGLNRSNDYGISLYRFTVR